MNDAQWIDKLMEQQEKLLDAKIKPLADDISEIKLALNGNGKPGLIKDVTDLKQKSAINAGISKAKAAIYGGIFSGCMFILGIVFTHALNLYWK